MRRVSRRKQDASSSSREAAARVPPTVSGAVRRQQPPQEILQQQRRKHHDEVQSLTTKNYRLAKELADLRLKHRDECKQVNRLTMENMNLASRCREAISHVAMFKKELAMQQKRTALALASQREQTKRMADSLTNSFISHSSPESGGGSQHRSSANKSSHRRSVGVEEDENVIRLVSSTPSPDRDTVHRQKIKNSNDRNDEKSPHSKSPVQTSAVTASASSRSKKPASSTVESRDSPATTATTAATSPTSDLEDEIVGDNIALVSSSISQSPEDEKNDPVKDQKTQKPPVMYSTPKKSERPKSSPFHVENDDGFDATTNGKGELFPVSASPKVFNNKANSNRGNKSYDEGFPSDKFEQAESENTGNLAKPKRKVDLMNSIDAFEQSFSTEFPESFTPKEGNNDASTTSSGSGQKIYNPFFATPEKPESRFDSSPFSTSKEDKASSESPKLEYRTPPKSAKNVPSTIDNNIQDLRPRRPEKTIPSAARARYERALGPRIESSTQSKQNIVNEVEKNASSSNGNDSGALYRRIQQRKRLDKNLESMSNGSTTVGPSVVSSSSSSEQKHHTREDIVDIVDAFEQNDSENTDNAGKAQKSSTASRFSGPIKSLRRRSVNKPISYAEPALNTKLRRGDTFFPKTRPDMTSSSDAQNQVPTVIQTTTAVVSP